ncbi:hypothetical protein [Sphingomonas sp.]|jgi:hypothetical protein|uniref:hypothetical protein n=1 Tax=Sphingomonas sp. TaxID=28214 RepID=UPI003F6F8074
MRRELYIPLLAALAGAGCQGELAEKPGWSALQGVEFSDRSTSTSGTEIRRLSDGFVVMAVEGRGNALDGPSGGVERQSRRMWILLNEHASDEQVKLMPRFASYNLPCSDVDDVQRSVDDIDAYVVRFLRTICIS